MTKTFPQFEAEVKQLSADLAEVENDYMHAFGQLFGAEAWAATKAKPEPAQERRKMLASLGEERAGTLRTLADAGVRAEASARVGRAEQNAATLTAQLADRDAQITGLKNEVALLAKDHKTVEQRAVELVSQVGHSPVALDPADKGPGVGGDVFAQYMAIKDPYEAGRFHDEHEGEILAALRNRQEK